MLHRDPVPPTRPIPAHQIYACGSCGRVGHLYIPCPCEEDGVLGVLMTFPERLILVGLLLLLGTLGGACLSWLWAWWGGR